jgi:hypothetical protein
MAVLWDVAPSSLVDIDPRFRGAYCLHHQGDGGGNEIQFITELRRTSFQLPSTTFQRIDYSTFLTDTWYYSPFRHTHYQQLNSPHASELLRDGATDNGI